MLFFVETISRQTFNSFIAVRFTTCISLMKRTRSTLKTHSAEERNIDDIDTDEMKTKSKGMEEDSMVQNNNFKDKELSNTAETLKPPVENIQNLEQKQTNKLNFKSLRDRSKEVDKEFRPNIAPPKSKPRAVVDLKMMKEELKQLEDPPLTAWEKEICSNRLPYSFFDCPCEELAQNLLGKVLVRCLENGTILKGRIVETEGYLGVIDKASHTYQNKVTPRNIPMYMPPGTIYIYMTYGMYHCFNISSQGEGCAVLIRAVEPLEGIGYMTNQRTSKRSSSASKKLLKDLKEHELCNGPSKLCMAFQLHKNHSKYSLCSWKGLWIENAEIEKFNIVKCRRIGIDNYGEEWTNKPLRYYIYGNRAVSKRNKEAEKYLELN
ncbi:putative 3-methyladenine DNA glycosylase isoform X2 [Bombus affinis]|uniref:putative 3-methyladenine DNA glycosylase isoform X2 n=1 Tax=Bombus affinis TaxID=309941 RepID=UPI0021B73B46|nr:putative 3-methyladenine DNA glycosylase isoform X2 [Bombus affinis]